ncbi:MAG: hypothetical protein SF123_19250 [Chloroflexota bacterium]|nr:hypothetical protein [Chloroflexota bacterium]
MGTRIERYGRPRRQRMNPALACGALLLVAVVICAGTLLLFGGQLRDAALGVVGLQASGDTDRIFAEDTATDLQLSDVTQPERIQVRLGDGSSRTLPVDNALYPLQIGTAPDGAQVATTRITESAALALCRQYTPVCQNADPRIQNIAVDFRPGGMIVSGDVTLPEFGGVTQRIGAVLTINGVQLDFAGIDIGGTLYATAPGELGAQVEQLEQTANSILRGASMTIDGRSYTPSALLADEQALTLVLR